MGDFLYNKRVVESNNTKKKDLRPVFGFLIKLALWYSLTSVLYNYLVVESPQALNPFLALITAQATDLLSWAGYNADWAHIEAGYVIFLDSILSVFVNEGCSAGKLYLLFFSLIFSFGGRIKDMLWFVPLGLAMVYVLNLFRIAYLSVVAYQYPAYFKLNHDYVVVIVLYGFMFLLWYIWINKYAIRVKVKEVDEA